MSEISVQGQQGAGSDEGTAWFDDVKVATTSATPDPVEVLTGRVEALESQVNSLTEQNASLQQRISALEGLIHNHGHHYLTGEGVGQNNLKVTTGPAVVPAVGEPVPLRE